TIFHVRAKIRYSKLKANPYVMIRIQEHTKHPMVNDIMGSIHVRDLENEGLRFRLKKKWLVREQANIPFRIRVSWKYPTPGPHYHYSADFFIH
ncbi:hypothetical protein BGZ65_010298, partial [Modicella reniformis]